jgi:hypothetical protein
MAANRNSLATNLAGAGKQPLPVNWPDGTGLLILPEHGRLLGLYAAEHDANFLWTNPALAEATSAQAYFRRAGWSNPGGDRTWLAPETRLFIGDPARPAETYQVPPALDPGHWTLRSAGAGEVLLENVTRLHWLRTAHEVEVRLTKQYSPADNPLSPAMQAQDGLRYAGYTQSTTLEVAPQTDPSIRLGLWNLLQLPQPGTMLIPTTALVQPQLFFGAVTTGELTVTPGVVRWHMGPPGGDAKIGIKAQIVTGRAGYWRETATPGIWELVVRQFQVDPTGEYVDALWSNGEEGWGFQACCVRQGAECFNELEYHAPAVTARAGGNRRQELSCVWAFRGAVEGVTRAARALLGTADAP